jgi:glycosyltransferase involved in cell wall biosynthesis
VPTISVVIPTLNRAALLPDAIRSVLAQTRSDFELLVVDDGSQDDTVSVVDEFAASDGRIRLLRQPRTMGISAALNRALAEARGTFVGRVDSDDIWLPDFLAATTACLEARPAAGVVYTRASAMDRHGKPLPKLARAQRGGPMARPGDAFGSLLLGDFTCNIAMLARRECFERVGGYDETLIANEDWDVWVRIARHAPFVFLDRVLARYRMHPGSITNPNSARVLEVAQSRLRVLDKAFADPTLPASLRALERTAYCNAHLHAGQRLLHAGHPRPSLRQFMRAFEVSGGTAKAAPKVAWAALSPVGLARTLAATYFRQA